MGCAASKSDEEDDVVSLCRERKRLLKSAVERRQALADAHSRYNHSLHAVAAAIRIIRKQEGIPELEEDMQRERREKEVANIVATTAAAAVDDDEEKNSDNDVEEQEGSGGDDIKIVGEDNVGQEEHNEGLSMIDNPINGRELLDALNDIEDHLVRAYGSGLDVSRMVEAKKINLQSGSEEVKEYNKRIHAITWHRTTSYQSSYCKSFLASSSKSSSTWTDLSLLVSFVVVYLTSFCHSHFQEGDKTRKTYEQKCSKLRSVDAMGDGLHFSDKTKAEVKDLYTRILVTIRSAESISKKIEKLRDEELQPQLVELLHGLMRNWKIMLESHDTQFRTIAEVGSFTCPTYGKFCNDSHRLATLQLEVEIHTWRACFVEYVTAQKSYIDALYGWLTKFLAPEIEFHSSRRSSAPPFCANGPSLLVICHDWLSSLEKLPDRAITNSLKSFGKDIRALWHQQGQEQEQKRKVDGFAKELDRRILAFQRTENRVLESKLTGQSSDIDARDRLQYLAERKDQLDMFRKRLDSEKEKHHNSMQETQRIILNAFQAGFSSIFESLAEFAKAYSKMYGDLVTYSENTKMSDEKSCNSFYIENGGYL
ncbi:protein of unknown function DUF632 [Dillenia turbinata]|uniref:DUF632 domain-containing protein n=1 Tax=Dillenia turbinata TaxID=194707 RepID=A0AAN8V424_9MAGN